MMRRRAGFTLIELLLAMSLATVLLAALWTAMDVHVRMFRGGQQDVASAQLGRALLRRMADDVRSTIAPATAPASDAAAPQAANAGPTRLRGTRRWLQLEVDQTAGVALAPAPIEQATAATAPATAAGLNLVTYFVREAAPTGGSEEPADGGLVRRELSCLYRDQLAAQERRPGQPSGAAAVADDEPPALTRSLEVDPLNASGAEAPSPEVLLSPEVESIEFRYFDGTTWLESWDSAAAGGLPRAIGIAIALAEEEEEGSGSEEALLDEPAVAPGGLAAGRNARTLSLFEATAEELPWKVYRLTVALAMGVENSTAAETLLGKPAVAPSTTDKPAAGAMP